MICVDKADAGQTTGNFGIVVNQGSIGRTRVAGIKVRNICIGKSLPVFREVVPQLGIAAKLLKLAIVAMSACALVLCTYNAVEFSHTEAVHTIGLNSSVAASLQTDVCLAAVLVHLTCNDVQYTPYGIAAIE